jgi:hypothetical protein
VTKPKKTKKPKKRKKPAWLSMVPGGKVLPTMTLEQLRSVKEVHALLTQEFPGPPVIGYAVRSFRFLELYGAACVVENKFPALTRSWKDLERHWGDVKTFPADARASIEDMIINKLFYVADEAADPLELYPTFMKLAGPYWMSVVATNEALPILDPDHFRSYLSPA